jgi:uncharacterized protein YbjT (DUF2867 family)
MSQLVTIFGGSGFLGRYIARRMAQQGWRVRVAVRRVNEAMFVRPYGAVGQVEPVFCNVRDDASVRAATAGADAVINCVGTFDAKGKNNFDAIHVQAAERIARIAAAEGVARMVQISAIGANADSNSAYARTKARGEAAVLAHMPDATILRPSVLFGQEDAFFNRFASMTRISPVLPVIGADTMFQPVYADDVAAAAVMGAVGDASGLYELGGPDAQSFRDLMQRMLDVVERRRLIVNIPFPIARLMAWGGGVAQTLSLGIVSAPVTADQVRSLAYDNVVPAEARGFSDLGLAPVSMEAVLPDYLWRFRPSGQYTAIKNSAKNLKI